MNGDTPTGPDAIQKPENNETIPPSYLAGYHSKASWANFFGLKSAQLFTTRVLRKGFVLYTRDYFENPQGLLSFTPEAQGNIRNKLREMSQDTKLPIQPKSNNLTSNTRARTGRLLTYTYLNEQFIVPKLFWNSLVTNDTRGWFGNALGGGHSTRVNALREECLQDFLKALNEMKVRNGIR